MSSHETTIEGVQGHGKGRTSAFDRVLGLELGEIEEIQLLLNGARSRESRFRIDGAGVIRRRIQGGPVIGTRSAVESAFSRILMTGIAVLAKPDGRESNLESGSDNALDPKPTGMLTAEPVQRPGKDEVKDLPVALPTALGSGSSPAPKSNPRNVSINAPDHKAAGLVAAGPVRGAKGEGGSELKEASPTILGRESSPAPAPNPNPNPNPIDGSNNAPGSGARPPAKAGVTVFRWETGIAAPNTPSTLGQKREGARNLDREHSCSVSDRWFNRLIGLTYFLGVLAAALWLWALASAF